MAAAPNAPTSANKHSAVLEAGQRLQSALAQANLHIVDAQKVFDTRTTTNDESIKLELTWADGGGLVDPAAVNLDLTAQLAFFRKLKFQYLEQKAKDQYIKIIVSDDAPSITAADNEAQRASNEAKKQALKERKLRLAEMYSNIRTLAPLVEQDYTKAKALSDETVDLARKILDARLKLTRLRQAYPQPRLTVPSAEAQLDAQVLEMQNLEDELQSMNENIDAVKDRVKSGAREVEKLRIEKGEAEKMVKMSRSEEEDGKVIGLYHWYTFAAKLHTSLHQLESFTSPSENELRLVYALRDRNSGSYSHRISITSLFVPNTHQLAEVQVTGLPSNDPMEDIIGAHIQANDMPGLIAAVLARAREEISGVV